MCPGDLSRANGRPGSCRSLSDSQSTKGRVDSSANIHSRESLNEALDPLSWEYPAAVRNPASDSAVILETLSVKMGATNYDIKIILYRTHLLVVKYHFQYNSTTLIGATCIGTAIEGHRAAGNSFATIDWQALFNMRFRETEGSKGLTLDEELEVDSMGNLAA